MCDYASRVGELLWSDLCKENLEAYKSYLVAVQDGLRIVVSGDFDGAAKLFGGKCCCVNNDVGVESSVVHCRHVGHRKVVDIDSAFDSSLGSKDNVDSGVGKSGLVVCNCGFPANSFGGCQCCFIGGGVDACLQPAHDGLFDDTAVDGGSVESSVKFTEKRCFGGLPRGPNFIRNKANRDAKKKRKAAAKREREQDQKVREQTFASIGEVERDRSGSGFWNSCSATVRQELIDSKARMHIAENERKEKESRMRLGEMDSPYAIMQKVVKMAEYAEKQAAKENNDRVYGWARTVATSSAESLAKSVPSSVPSFRELEEKLAASSQSSFDLELARKDDELDKEKRKNSELEMVVAELKLAKGIIDGSEDHYNVPKLEQPCYSVEKKTKKSSGFVKTKKQPWPHVQIGRYEAHAEY